jgi:para-nitrobenzyl esterase
MRKLFIVAIIAAQVSLLAAFMAAQDTVTIETGKIKGSVSEGVISFKGIPYAAPPVGELRWRPPQPAARRRSMPKEQFQT